MHMPNLMLEWASPFFKFIMHALILKKIKKLNPCLSLLSNFSAKDSYFNLLGHDQGPRSLLHTKL
jgi:hypothetical protein